MNSASLVSEEPITRMGYCGPQLYTVIKDGQFVLSEVPGAYAGIVTKGIFGRLECKSGMYAKRENRVFFATLEDAVKMGFRPCNKCKPLDEEHFERVKSLVREPTLNEFYRRPMRRIDPPTLSESLRW